MPKKVVTHKWQCSYGHLHSTEVSALRCEEEHLRNGLESPRLQGKSNTMKRNYRLVSDFLRGKTISEMLQSYELGTGYICRILIHEIKKLLNRRHLRPEDIGMYRITMNEIISQKDALALIWDHFEG